LPAPKNPPCSSPKHANAPPR